MNPSHPDDDNLRTTYAGAKRRIAALEEQLQNMKDAGSKCKSYCVNPFVVDPCI
jgi:hypothetical protein